MKHILEPMSERHRRQVIDIYDHYIDNSFAAYPERGVDYDFFGRFLDMSKGYRSVAVITESGSSRLRIPSPIFSCKHFQEDGEHSVLHGVRKNAGLGRDAS